MVAVAVYLLCGVTSIICTILLVRAYYRTSNRLTFWSALCFGCLAINNILLVLDFVVFPAYDLSMIRLAPLIIGASFMVYGTFWDPA